MKDRNFIKFLVCALIILAFLALGAFTYKIYNKNREYESKEKEIQRKEQELQDQENRKAAEKAEYEKFLNENVYDNTIPISFYMLKGNEYVKTSELRCNWARDSIFGLCYAIPSAEERLSGANFKTIFKENWDKYEKSSEYKIGYSIKLQLDTGEVINKRILEPKDTEELFAHIQFYLYDDVTYMPGRRYYHMTQEELLEETMLTSVKLVGYKETKGVNGPIELTVFTYNGDEDFDSNTGEYLGNSKFTMKIYREQV